VYRNVAKRPGTAECNIREPAAIRAALINGSGSIRPAAQTVENVTRRRPAAAKLDAKSAISRRWRGVGDAQTLAKSTKRRENLMTYSI